MGEEGIPKHREYEYKMDFEENQTKIEVLIRRVELISTG